MVFYVKTPKRELVIDEIYLMFLAFFIAYFVTEITKKVIKRIKLKRNNKKESITIYNPQGGDLDDMVEKFSRFKFQMTDERELAYTILTCIADDHRYILKDEYLTKVIFSLVQTIVKDQSIILSPNMLRFLALQLLRNNDNNLQIKVGNIFFESMNRGRILIRVAGSLLIGTVASALTALPYAILTMIVYFQATKNSGFRCSEYFEQLPNQGPVLMEEKRTGPTIFIGDSKPEIYVPKYTRKTKKVRVITKSELESNQRYKRVRCQPKEVKFIDFQKSDPVLSRFRDQNLEEPYINQNTPPGKEIHDLIDSSID